MSNIVLNVLTGGYLTQNAKLVIIVVLNDKDEEFCKLRLDSAN